ncbi:MAG: hypothetical protein IKG79_01175, partial [Neisseriaceae bacterium]|nr:hypothetical protein [Neisseriaceae bacterium]
LDTELTYKPTLRQRLIRVILGTLLVPLFGDICMILFLFSHKLTFESVSELIFTLKHSYLGALILTGIPTFIWLFIWEKRTDLGIRFISSLAFALILGCCLYGLFGWISAGMFWFIPSSLIAVSLSELLLYQHIKRCIKKTKSKIVQAA